MRHLAVPSSRGTARRRRHRGAARRRFSGSQDPSSGAWSRAPSILEKTMKFVAFERKLQGTGASRRLRNADKVPGIVYGGANAASLIELDHNALFHALKKEAFHSSIL